VTDVAQRVVRAAEAISDDVSADVGTQRMDVHEKNAWMLRSHLE
jgi:starvation-inducible DNA-binding protein